MDGAGHQPARDALFHHHGAEVDLVFHGFLGLFLGDALCLPHFIERLPEVFVVLVFFRLDDFGFGNIDALRRRFLQNLVLFPEQNEIGKSFFQGFSDRGDRSFFTAFRQHNRLFVLFGLLFHFG
jgi:hypothetical protein